MDEETIAQRVIEKLFSRTQLNEGVYLMRELNQKLEALSKAGGTDWKGMASILIQAVIALLLVLVLKEGGGD